MQQIDRLILKARRAVKPNICAGLCFIDFDETAGIWKAVPQLWGGVVASGCDTKSIPENWGREYATAEEAVCAAEMLFKSLDISAADSIIFIMDYG